MNLFIFAIIFILFIFAVFKNTLKMRRFERVSNDISIYEQTKELSWEQASEYIDKISRSEQESIDLKKKIVQIRSFKGIV